MLRSNCGIDGRDQVADLPEDHCEKYAHRIVTGFISGELSLINFYHLNITVLVNYSEFLDELKMLKHFGALKIKDDPELAYLKVETYKGEFWFRYKAMQ